MLLDWVKLLALLNKLKAKIFLSPPYLLKSWLSLTACITEPAPKNNSPL